MLAVAAGWSRRWALGCACCGQPRATAAAGLVAARACCCATFRSLPSVGQRFSRARPEKNVCRAEPSISLPSARGRLVSSASEAWLQPHETSRRGLRRGSEPCFDRPPSTSRGSPLTQRHAIKTPCDRRSKRPAAGAAANEAVAPSHHRGLRFAPPLERNASRKTAADARAETAPAPVSEACTQAQGRHKQ